VTVHQSTEPSHVLRHALRDLVADGTLEFPLPGRGHTSHRLRTLARIAADELELARLAEAHLDAVTILREAGRDGEPNALYGVWASDAPTARCRLTARQHEQPVVAGRKAFCSGAGLVDRALVTAHDDADRVHLIDLDLRTSRVLIDTSSWTAPVFAATNTATITLADTTLHDHQIIGPPNWYLDRIGFWHGALAPAACWAGGATGLIDHCLRHATTDADSHLAAHLGMLDTTRWTLDTLVAAAGDGVDEHPADHDMAVRLAYRARSAVEHAVTTALDHATRAFGPRLLVNDAWAARRVAELQLYVRQHHDTRDHATLGRLAARLPHHVSPSRGSVDTSARPIRSRG
jgi:hypothetical protein